MSVLLGKCLRFVFVADEFINGILREEKNFELTQ
jgi:hypothetical protein